MTEGAGPKLDLLPRTEQELGWKGTLSKRPHRLLCDTSKAVTWCVAGTTKEIEPSSTDIPGAGGYQRSSSLMMGPCFSLGIHSHVPAFGKHTTENK